jgi:hypothetical protein
MRYLPAVDMTQWVGEDDKRKELPIVIPPERSDEGSPNAANCSTLVISMERSDDDCKDAGGRATQDLGAP